MSKKRKFLNGERFVSHILVFRLENNLSLPTFWGSVGTGQLCDIPVFLSLCDSCPCFLVQLGIDFSKTPDRKPQVTSLMITFGFKIKYG